MTTSMKGANGEVITDKQGILERCAKFFEGIYDSKADRPVIKRLVEADVPEVIPEISRALAQMKNNKATGEDGISTGILKIGGQNTPTNSMIVNYTPKAKKNTRTMVMQQ